MKRRTGSVLQRRPSSLGRTPDISMPRVKIPPEVPSPWANVSPASSRACTTPACHAHADSAARQHERTPWFAGHRS